MLVVNFVVSYFLVGGIVSLGILFLLKLFASEKVQIICGKGAAKKTKGHLKEARVLHGVVINNRALVVRCFVVMMITWPSVIISGVQRVMQNRKKKEG